MDAEQLYEHYKNSNNDICQHLQTLREYTVGLDTVVELGVRSIVSTWAFLLARPKQLISVDMAHPTQYAGYDPLGCDIDLVYREAERLGVKYEFILTYSISARLPECDLMFFDTEHTYEQLTMELAAHKDKVLKYMIFHDTETYKEELVPALVEFLNDNHRWRCDKIYSNNNGLTIFKHI